MGIFSWSKDLLDETNDDARSAILRDHLKETLQIMMRMLEKNLTRFSFVLFQNVQRFKPI